MSEYVHFLTKFALLLAAAIIAFLLYHHFLSEKNIRHHESFYIKGEPTQKETARVVFNFEGNRVTCLNTYSGTVMIEGKERYRFGDMADIIPYDFIFAWGDITRDSYRSRIDYWQDHRWYLFQVSAENMAYLDIGKISKHSANTHVLYMNQDVRRKMSEVEKGNVIRFNGCLAEVIDKNGGRIISSTRRDDTGAGACEVLLLDNVEVLR